jgi:hypothetical protein
MKSMRQLISLTEGVMAVPGVGTEADMQTAGTVGRNQAYAAFDASQESVAEDGQETAWSTYNRRNSVEEAHVDSCRMEQDGVIRDQCAMEGIMGEDSQYDLDFISSSIRKNYDLATSQEELMRMVAGETGYGQNPDFANMFSSSLDHFLNGDDTSFDHMGDDEDDYTDQSMRAGEMGMEEANNAGKRAPDIDPNEINILAKMPVDAAKAKAAEMIAATRTSDVKKAYLMRQVGQARTSMDLAGILYNMVLKGEGNGVQGSGYSKKFDNAMEEDFSNGYDTEQYANGSDFFPNGADGPVVVAVGPSGARQGDNPEQKKMQVAEVHKELVYGYRKYLKEARK